MPRWISETKTRLVVNINDMRTLLIKELKCAFVVHFKLLFELFLLILSSLGIKGVTLCFLN